MSVGKSSETEIAFNVIVATVIDFDEGRLLYDTTFGVI
jgi:hypothetical protein